MTQTLIPFGYHPEKDEFLAISEVEQGKACGCICPSCEVPLIARRPKDNIIWHFAHSSKAVYESVKAECEYNVFLSLRMFCRKILTNGFELTLPEYRKTLEGYTLTEPSILISHEYPITNERVVTLDSVEVEKIHLGISVDFIAKIKNYQIVIYLTHPDRPFPELIETNRGSDDVTAILEIDITTLLPILSERTTYTQLSDFIRERLMNDVKNKKWHFHPRELKLDRAAKNTLDDEIREYEKSNVDNRRNRPISSVIERIASQKEQRSSEYLCSSCSTRWKMTEGYICPTCHSVWRS